MTYYWSACRVDISEIIDKQSSVIVYPNPTTGKLKIAMISEQLTMNNVELFDIVGSKIPTLKTASGMSENEIGLDFSHLPAGIYFLKFDNKVVKVIKF